jgi:hypothetical protein
MRLDRGPESYLGDTLLAASLKALTTDQPSAELVMPAASCEPLYANQSMRIALLAIIPTLDDVDIAPVQRGDQTRGVVIPRSDGPGGAAGGDGHGGVPVGGGPTGSHSGSPAGSQGAPPAVLVPLAVPAPQPPARENRRVSSLMTMRYHLTRMSLYKSGCGNSPVLGWRCLMRRP